MKYLFRGSLVWLIVSYALLHLFKSYFLEQELLGSVLVISGAVAGLVFVIGMFVYWAKNKFENIYWKVAWFFVLIVSYYVIGPMIFYIVVYENRKTLKINVELKQ